MIDPREDSQDDDLEQRKREIAEWELVLQQARISALQDRDYYDGVQWTAKEKAILDARNQPAIVFNRIAPKINYVLGTLIESRVSPRAYPRNRTHDGDADAITDGLRYEADADEFEFKYTLVGSNVFIEGVGGVVFYPNTENIEEATSFGTEFVPFARIFFDPASSMPDFSDAGYCGLMSWVSLAEARGRWLGASKALEDSIGLAVVTTEHDAPKTVRWYRADKHEIQVIEHYYREYDSDTGKMCWYECTYCAGGYLVEPRKVQLLDDKGDTWCPLWLCSAYIMDGTTETHERYGVGRNMKGPQDEINHRRSKAVHLVHTVRMMFETGALADPEEAQAQMMSPDGMIEVSPGRLRDKAVLVMENADLAAPQVQMLQEAKNEIDQVGPRPIPVAQHGEKISGRLFIAQQETGALELKPVFDNLKRWARGVYRRYYWLIRQIWSHEKWMAIRDDEVDDGFRFVGLNLDMTRGERLQELLDHQTEFGKAMKLAFGPLAPEMTRMFRASVMQKIEAQVAQAQASGQKPTPPPPEYIQAEIVKAVMADPVSQKMIKVNDVAQTDLDIIIETAPSSAIIEHEQFTEFVGMIREGMMNLPPNILALVIEMSSFRNKDKLKAALMPPPDPAAQQAAQQAQQMQQAEVMKRIEMLGAQVASLTAQAQKSQAQAAAIVSKTQGEPPQLSAGLKQAEMAESQARAQLDQAQAALAIAKAQAVPSEVLLNQQQARKAAHDASQPPKPDGPPAQGV